MLYTKGRNFTFCIQQQGENIETYVRKLYDLAEYANFDNKDENIRDRFAVELLDKELSEKLQLCSQLTLKEAITQARQFEQVRSQLSKQRQTVDAVTQGQGRSSNWHPRQGKESAYKTQQSQKRKKYEGTHIHQSYPRGGSYQGKSKCGYCGKQPHPNSPARGKVCKHCGRYNHFAAVCRQRVNVDSVQKAETYFLGTVNSNNIQPWNANIKIGHQQFKFKIDTGADVSVMTYSSYSKLEPRPKLLHTNAILRSAGGIMKCYGYFTTEVVAREQKYRLQIFVFDSNADNLLGRAAACEMGFVARIDEVNKEPFGDLDEHPVKCKPVRIEIKDNAEPYSLKVPRRIPIPLLEKVKAELERMKASNVIEEITEPTDWCAGMVAVRKKNGAVRICTDLKKMNMSIKRER